MVERVLESDLTVRTWGDAYGYVLLATGRVEAMADPLISVWDIAPMRVIIPEAGGRVSDEHGKPWVEGGAFVASNGLVHDELIAVLSG
jgi:fructose-1,6-bisphosphatase/inositol monophosphatase family enzyme